MVFLVIISDFHEELGNAYVSYDNFVNTSDSGYVTNEKEFSFTGAKYVIKQITSEKYILASYIISNTTNSI